jgi:hypothetical protein
MRADGTKTARKTPKPPLFRAEILGGSACLTATCHQKGYSCRISDDTERHGVLWWIVTDERVNRYRSTQRVHKRYVNKLCW